jgi:hypothetical protein
MTKKTDIMLRIGKEDVFLFHSFENAVIKITGNKSTRCFAKFKGKQAYELDYDTNLVSQAIERDDEITELQYEKF